MSPASLNHKQVFYKRKQTRATTICQTNMVTCDNSNDNFVGIEAGDEDNDDDEDDSGSSHHEGKRGCARAAGRASLRQTRRDGERRCLPPAGQLIVDEDGNEMRIRTAVSKDWFLKPIPKDAGDSEWKYEREKPHYKRFLPCKELSWDCVWASHPWTLLSSVALLQADRCISLQPLRIWWRSCLYRAACCAWTGYPPTLVAITTIACASSKPRPYTVPLNSQ
jgi:hypothetical protein